MHLTPYTPSWLSLFDHTPRTRLVYGAGAVGRVGEIVQELGGERVLLVTDKGIAAAGHAGKIVDLLQGVGLSVALYDESRENPTTEDVARCVDAARRGQIDFIVGLGGGSSMDTAKGCNFILTNGGRMQDYWGIGKAKLPMLPLVAIPTTSGTGSEMQSFALISDEVTHQKMACGDPKAAARVAILDPELTVSQPRRVTACTGIDALAHSLETAVTLRRSPLSLMYSREAFRLCVDALPIVLAQPGDVEARGRMLLGAALAGLAIENSMLGAAHSSANPLTAHHGVIHGQAVGLMLPEVIRFNAEDSTAATLYREHARAAGMADAAEIAGRIEHLMEMAGLRERLRTFGVVEEELPKLALEAAAQWTAQFNPRPVVADEFARMYQQIL